MSRAQLLTSPRGAYLRPDSVVKKKPAEISNVFWLRQSVNHPPQFKRFHHTHIHLFAAIWTIQLFTPAHRIRNDFWKLHEPPLQPRGDPPAKLTSQSTVEQRKDQWSESDACCTVSGSCVVGPYRAPRIDAELDQ